MLPALEALLDNIKSVLDTDRQALEDMDIALLKASLVKLMEAINDLDPQAINDAVDNIQPFAQVADIADDVEAVLSKVLLCEYDEAVVVIKNFLRKLEASEC